jgi:hypothetical protein
MKLLDTRTTAIVAAGCLLLSGFVYHARTEASGQEAKPMNANAAEEGPAGSVTINGEAHEIMNGEPFSVTQESSDGSSHVDVSIQSHSSGSATSSQHTNVEIRTDNSTEIQTTYQSEQHIDE